jgi:UTP-glucose-1-phosphate uridylyltransferase
MSQTLVVLAAGLSTRYGGNKQLASVGPNNEVLLDYAVYDAAQAGFECVTFVIRRDLKQVFEKHTTQKFGKKLQIAFAYQDLHDLPAEFELPATRRKPWGTAHAILASRYKIDGPFVVINADDFYGGSSYESLFKFRAKNVKSDIPEFAMIGYSLSDTLSDFGGVSRGICNCTESGFLERIVEVKQIRFADEELAGVTTSGDRYALKGNETVSMNIWALTPAVFPVLARQFEEFLREQGDDPEAEFLISSALNEQISAGIAKLRVIAARDRWFGMTFQADRPRVMSEIAALVEYGAYPKDLRTWFEANE